jgi:DNA topoisomerase-1
MAAATALRELGPARLVRERKANIVRAVDKVARLLGNTRTVCRKYYIHPVILDEYGKGQVVPGPGSRPGGRQRSEVRLRDDEIAVLDFIRECQGG